MKALLLTNEYPPHIYGGAGVHVEFLSRELARLMDVEVRCFGDQRVDDGRADGARLRGGRRRASPPRSTCARSSARCRATWPSPRTNVDADVVHCHTWYTHLAGILVKQAYGIPLVMTTHSLEPLRPWKREQLGGGYDAPAGSSGRRCERPTRSSPSPGDAGRRPAPLRRRSRAGPRHPQRHRPDALPPDAADRRPDALRHRPRSALRPLRRADHPPEGDHPPRPRHPDDRPGARRSSSAPARPTRRRSPPRWRRPSRRCSARRAGRHLGAARWCRATP